MTRTYNEHPHPAAIQAVVTGATGMIGRQIVRRLLEAGYRVRVLSRRATYPDPRVELFRADLLDGAAVTVFLRDAQLLFHCAAELHDQQKMRAVNVEGTRLLIEKARGCGVGFFCHISSAGVVGRTTHRLIDEATPCNPRNEYEKSKLAAEKLFANGIEGCRTVILRPTNVIDDERPGPFSLALEDNWLNKLRLFIKGRECAHLLHAEDVAAAALFFVDHRDIDGCFLVSRDNDADNTYAELWRLCRLRLEGTGAARRPQCLPLAIPYLWRLLSGRPANPGDVRFLANKLLAAGFTFPGSIQEMASRICACPSKKFIY